MFLFKLKKAAFAAFFFSGTLLCGENPTPDQAWNNLLHYKKGKSNLDGPLFFLATDGKNNAQSELLSDIEKLPKKELTGGHFKQPLYCVFPARVHYLKNKGLWTGEQKLNCPDFNEWKEGIGGSHPKIYLSFSTSFPNNPASAFGHTFLRIQRGEGPNDLLDYTVSINAEIPADTGQLLYALKGLFGAFKTFIDIAPFFQKIQEYNISENRDLYEYELNLNSEEIDFLLEHIWEIYSTSWFDYYFLDENCSSFLAEILQAIKNLPLGHNRFYYLPSDLVKLSFSNNLISSERKTLFRPGSKKKWRYLYSELSKKQKESYKGLLLEGRECQDIDVLNSALLEYNIKQHQTSNQLKENDKINFRKTLIYRSKIKSSGQEILIPNDNRPELSHSPTKISLESAIWNFQGKREVVNSFKLKLGHHDELDNPKGFEPFSRFDFLGFSLSHFTLQHKLKITEIKGITIYSATPITRTHRQLSWQAHGAVSVALDSTCTSCLAPQGKTLFGTTFSFNRQDSLLFVPMIGAFLSSGAGNVYKKGFRIGPILEFAQFVKWGPILSSFKGNWYRDYYSERKPWLKFSAELAFPFLREQEMRIEYNSFYQRVNHSWRNNSNAIALNYGVHF